MRSNAQKYTRLHYLVGNIVRLRLSEILKFAMLPQNTKAICPTKETYKIPLNSQSRSDEVFINQKTQFYIDYFSDPK